jgi:formylmethanofuran dehydrogenase subunit B
LKRIPTIFLDYPNVSCPFTPTVRFTTAIYGIHTRGTAYRMDEVPIPLKAILPATYATDHAVLNVMLTEIKEQNSACPVNAAPPMMPLSPER